MRPNIYAISVSKGTEIQYMKFILYACNHQKLIFARFVQKSLSCDFKAISDIVSIISPFRNGDCVHIRSSSWLSLPSYLVPIIKFIAIISGPALYVLWNGPNKILKTIHWPFFVDTKSIQSHISSIQRNIANSATFHQVWAV